MNRSEESGTSESSGNNQGVAREDPHPIVDCDDSDDDESSSEADSLPAQPVTEQRGAFAGFRLDAGCGSAASDKSLPVPSGLPSANQLRTIARKLVAPTVSSAIKEVVRDVAGARERVLGEKTGAELSGEHLGDFHIDVEPDFRRKVHVMAAVSESKGIQKQIEVSDWVVEKLGRLFRFFQVFKF